VKKQVLEAAAAGWRIDRYLAEALKILTRSQLKQRVTKIILNGIPVKLSKKIKNGDWLEIYYNDPPELDVTPEDIPLHIIYEDANVCVIDKPQGMVVHPAGGNYAHTLVNALLYHYQELREQFPEQNFRPGIVHRLDKDTSGVIITAKNIPALEFLSAQFKERKAKKTYLALVNGRMNTDGGRIETYIFRDPGHRKRFLCSEEPPAGGIRARRALTLFKVLKAGKDSSLLVLKPYTGRTHQLRAQMKFLGAPIIGDELYGSRKARRTPYGLMLHAYKLRIRLPDGGGERQFKAPLPVRFKKMLGGTKRGLIG